MNRDPRAKAPQKVNRRAKLDVDLSEVQEEIQVLSTVVAGNASDIEVLLIGVDSNTEDIENLTNRVDGVADDVQQNTDDSRRPVQRPRLQLPHHIGTQHAAHRLVRPAVRAGQSPRREHRRFG